MTSSGPRHLDPGTSADPVLHSFPRGLGGGLTSIHLHLIWGTCVSSGTFIKKLSIEAGTVRIE